MLKLLSFKQTSNRRFELAFDKKIESVLIVFKEDLPRELCPAASAFFEGEALYFKINSRSFVFDIPETIDDRSKEYSLVMQITLGRGIFELVHDRFGLRRGVDKAYFFELVDNLRDG